MTFQNHLNTIEGILEIGFQNKTGMNLNSFQQTVSNNIHVPISEKEIENQLKTKYPYISENDFKAILQTNSYDIKNAIETLKKLNLSI